MLPKKLQEGDCLRIIAPSNSLLPKLTKEIIECGVKRLNGLGLKVSFAKHIKEVDEFKSTTVEHRLEDLHEAFSDKAINGILALSGGTSCNQLLKHINYDLVKANPKIICGLSDITALLNAIYIKTGMVTYYGPHFSAIAASEDADFTLDYFKRSLMEGGPIELKPSEIYYNTPWTKKENSNTGYWIINQGSAEGIIVGGNFLTFNFIQGTEYAANGENMDRVIYILEDNGAESVINVQNQLQSLLLQPNFKNVCGILIGRFRKESKMNRDLLTKIIKTKGELSNLPVVANIDFGHTVPLVTFPIGGIMKIEANDDSAKIYISENL